MSGPAVVILRGVRGLLCAALVVVAAPGVAQAVTVTVMNTNDSGTGSLRAAIATTNAQGGGTIDFQSGVSGTITLTTGVLSITQSVNIAGPGAGVITVSGHNDGNNPVFDIAPGSGSPDVVISGLTITGGNATTNGGGILANDLVHSLTLSGDTISGNQVAITNPGAASGGGGVYVNGGSLAVSSSTITGNSVTLTGSASDSSGGGGIYSNSNGGSVTVTGSDVSNNTVDQAASTGSSGGGGIYANSSDVAITTSTVDGNTATIRSSTGGDEGGGGIYANAGTVSLEDASVDANTAHVTDGSTVGNDGGGGVYSNGDGVGAIFSSISQNTATVSANGNGNDNGGGAIYDDSLGSVYLASTLSGNSVSLSGSGTQNGGGAIYSFGANQISDLTIAGNSINAPGGGLFASTGASFTLENTIIADNASGNCGGAGAFRSDGFNLESANTCGLTPGNGDLVNTEPKLGPLQNNGGPTPTQALLAGSPAIDAGSCNSILGTPLNVDQRGVPRPQPAGGKCDIGAFELVPGSGSPPPPAPAPSPPAAVPGPPAATSSTGAGFSGAVNPEGQATTVFFQYGIDSRYRPGGGTSVIYDQSTPAQSLPADTTPHTVSASASGLVPNALYHVRLVATNATGTTFGPDQTFTTPPGPAPPPPVLGQTVNAKPVSGQVFILVGTKLVPLTQGRQLPSGAVVDARAGSLELTTAAGKGHTSQTGVFGGAIFKVTQARGGQVRGLTTLKLMEGAFAGAPSYASCKAHKAGDATTAAVSSKTLQLLHASAHGKFSTSGRYSAATVRGTKWTIADRCDGTLTHDITDSVAVTDFVHHKTIVLHAGQSYLARARRK